jgi:hypothetical protein
MHVTVRAHRWVIPLGVCALAVACSGDAASAGSDAGTRPIATAEGGRRAGDAAGSATSGSGGAGAGRAAAAAGAEPASAGRGSPAADSGVADGAGGAGGAGGHAAASPPPAMSADAGNSPEGGAVDSGPSAADCQRCGAYATPMQTGTVGTAELDALSGLAIGRAQPDIVFVHNDHDRAVVYALDLQGKLHARIALEGAMAEDIEDIAIGPCGTQSCVYLADIGDNSARRGEYAILRFVEPSVPNAPGTTEMTTAFERFRFSYEDGSHNAESLMVAPDGTLYVVTKLAPGSGGRVVASGPSSVYRLTAPLSATATARATLVATLPVPAEGELALSAAAAHPCGLGFLLRTYDRVYEFLTPAAASFEAAFQVTPTTVAMPDEPQSEGIDYRADGRGFVTSGEGAGAPLVVTSCSP